MYDEICCWSVSGIPLSLANVSLLFHSLFTNCYRKTPWNLSFCFYAPITHDEFILLTCTTLSYRLLCNWFLICFMVGLDLKGLFQPKGFYDSSWNRGRNTKIKKQYKVSISSSYLSLSRVTSIYPEEKVGSSHLDISWHSEERFDKNRARQPPEAVLLWVQEQEARSRCSLHKESSQPPALFKKRLPALPRGKRQGWK